MLNAKHLDQHMLTLADTSENGVISEGPGRLISDILDRELSLTRPKTLSKFIVMVDDWPEITLDDYFEGNFEDRESKITIDSYNFILRDVNVVSVDPDYDNLEKACCLHCERCKGIFEFTDTNLLVFEGKERVRDLSQATSNSEYVCPECADDLKAIYRIVLEVT